MNRNKANGLLFHRSIHGESTKGFTYTFGEKTSPGIVTDGSRVPYALRSGVVGLAIKIDSDIRQSGRTGRTAEQGSSQKLLPLLLCYDSKTGFFHIGLLFIINLLIKLY